MLAFFRRQNGRAFFPTLPIAALLRRRLGGDEGRIARVGMLPRCPADFATQKADGFLNHAGRWCEPEGLSPEGGLYRPTGGESYQTCEPWHLSCHGGNSAAKLLSFGRPRALWARDGVKGGERKTQGGLSMGQPGLPLAD